MEEQQGQIRFTPDEIRELMESQQLKREDMMRMHPDDRKVALRMSIEMNYDHPEEQSQGGPLYPPGMGALASGVVGGMKRAIPDAMPKVVPSVVKAAITGAGIKAGHPIIGSAMGAQAANKVREWFGKGSAPVRPARPAPQAPSPPAKFTGTAELPESVGNFGHNAQRMTPGTFSLRPTGTTAGGTISRPGASSAPTGASSGPLKRERPILGSTSLDDEIAERVKGGVQNDFRGPVSIQRPGFANSAYPSGNITTESTTDEIIEMILGLSRQGQTPMRWADPADRRAVDGLKRKTQRRTPR